MIKDVQIKAVQARVQVREAEAVMGVSLFFFCIGVDVVFVCVCIVTDSSLSPRVRLDLLQTYVVMFKAIILTHQR